jgi:hypothetical protein
MIRDRWLDDRRSAGANQRALRKVSGVFLAAFIIMSLSCSAAIRTGG